MTQLTASVAIGTAATLLAIILLLLRAKFQGRRLLLALTRRWVASGTRTSGLVLALLCAIAVYSIAHIPEIERNASSSGPALSGLAGAPSVQSASALSEARSSDAQGWQDLRAYADTINTKGQPEAATPPAARSAELPDVDSMIAKLLARLEKQPDDVKGWKMLAWSYLNMDRTEEATKAYETALKLEPGDVEIQKGLEAAKSAKTVTTQTPESNPSSPATSPIAQDIKAAEGQSALQTNSMIRGMVDQLATRLETSPNDEDGWLRLMRSRMTLGEMSAAKAALTKALETFASDSAAKARLTAAARYQSTSSY
jgi:cytochrome c-type biogenesis protein CcmH